MDAVDLRNLVCHLLEVEEARIELIAAQEDAIEYLRLLHQNDQYRMDCRRRLDDIVRRLKNMEQDLEQNYEEFMPRPQMPMEGDICETDIFKS
jgi:uncharacterized coiled-coil protein SlyX